MQIPGWIPGTWVSRSCAWIMDGNYWNLEYGTSLSRALFQYKHFVCLEAEDPGAYALILEDVGGRAVHWSGPVWSPQSSVLWGWDGQRPLPKLADSACFFFLGCSPREVKSKITTTYFYRFSQFPSQLSRFWLALYGFHFSTS